MNMKFILIFASYSKIISIFVVRNGQITKEHLKRRHMTKEQKTAIARIISDMVKADNSIEENEVKDMKRLMSDYTTALLKST